MRPRTGYYCCSKLKFNIIRLERRKLWNEEGGFQNRSNSKLSGWEKSEMKTKTKKSSRMDSDILRYYKWYDNLSWDWKKKQKRPAPTDSGHCISVTAVSSANEATPQHCAAYESRRIRRGRRLQFIITAFHSLYQQAWSIAGQSIVPHQNFLKAKTYKKLRLEPVTLTLATRPQPFYATLRLPKLYHCAKFEVAALKSVKEMSRTSESIQKLRLDTVTLTLTPRPQLFLRDTPSSQVVPLCQV